MLLVENLLDLHLLTRVEVEQEGDLVEVVGLSWRMVRCAWCGVLIGRTGYQRRNAQHGNRQKTCKHELLLTLRMYRQQLVGLRPTSSWSKPLRLKARLQDS